MTAARTAPAVRTVRSLLTLPLVVALALAALLAGVGPASAGTTVAGSAGEWQDGRSDHDTIPDPISGGTGVGVSANVGWRSDSGQVPKVGEIFYVRGYAGLVTVPWSGEVAILPELMLPSGVVPADDVKPIRWAQGQVDDPQDFSTRELTFDRGANGGFLIGTPEGEPWTLRRGEVMEIQVPVRATRELKGPATQKPECQSRIEGTAPCPIGQSGDHFQMAFTVGGHSGDKQYVTPYVGLFAQSAAPASSTTTATYAKSGGAWKAAVTVRADGGRQATSGVQVRDNGRTIARGTVGAGGKVTVRLPRLAKGKHRLSVKYAGSSSVSGSTSRTTTVTVR